MILPVDINLNGSMVLGFSFRKKKIYAVISI